MPIVTPNLNMTLPEFTDRPDARLFTNALMKVDAAQGDVNQFIDSLSAEQVAYLNAALPAITSVKQALDAIETNKVGKTGDAMTGTLSVPSLSISPAQRYASMNFYGTNSLVGTLTTDDTVKSLYLRVTRTGNENRSVVLTYNDTQSELKPDVNNDINLGSTLFRWKDTYLTNSPNVGSDHRIKKDISELSISVITKLLMSIPPVQYRLKDGDSGRYHYGFVAQDVEAALTKAELSTMDFAGFIKSPALDEDGIETGDYIYALRLEEFIPILWAKCQDFEKRLQAAGL